ncbi:MAG: hypothetical protein ACE5HS_08675 [bacterium]
MRQKIFTTFWFVLFLNVSCFSQDQGFGLGIIVGEPTGISLKKWVGESRAFDGAVAWSFSGKNSLAIHLDYINHYFRFAKPDAGKLPFYYGIGGRLKFDDGDDKLGARIPLGLNYHFENLTLDLFVEIVPILDLIPDTEFDLNAAIGVRYFFK